MVELDGDVVDMEFDVNWSFALGQPVASAAFKRSPDDFRVDELLGFEPEGEGEHLYVQIEKTNQNTAWVAVELARVAEVDARTVGYAGLKDRRAVTTQWMSLQLPGKKDPDWSAMELDGVRVLASGRHPTKLRRGDHQGNRFVIRLYPSRPIDIAAMQTRLQQVAQQGVPNYFGLQRFGREGNNLTEWQSMVDRGVRRVKGRDGFKLSAARSYLFNQVLSARVALDTWQTPIDGDVLENGLPTGPLWGRGRTRVAGESAQVESSSLQAWAAWQNALEHVGLKQERRSLACLPEDFTWSVLADEIELRFKLPPGCYATSVLREIVQLEETPARSEEKRG